MEADDRGLVFRRYSSQITHRVTLHAVWVAVVNTGLPTHQRAPIPLQTGATRP